MKASRSFKAVLAVMAVLTLALAPLPLHAQGGGQRGGMGGPGGGMMAARALVEQGSVAFLVTRATDLELTADQTARLTVIDEAWSAATKESRDRIRAAMPQRGQGTGGGGDRQAMMQRMQDLQPVLQQLRADDEKALDEAMKLLAEPQRARAKQLLTERTESMRPRRGG